MDKNGNYKAPSVNVITAAGYKELGDTYIKSREHKPIVICNNVAQRNG